MGEMRKASCGTNSTTVKGQVDGRDCYYIDIPGKSHYFVWADFLPKRKKKRGTWKLCTVVSETNNISKETYLDFSSDCSTPYQPKKV